MTILEVAIPVGAVLFVLAIWLHVIIYGRIEAARSVQRLKADGRAISDEKAIANQRMGLGTILHNSSDLPGSWWFLFHVDRKDDRPILLSVEESGYLIVFEDRQGQKAFEARYAQSEEIHASLVD